MRFFFDPGPNEVEVLFPYTYIYPEQYEYMKRLKAALDAGKPAILEMPSGTGKTISLLSLIVSYQAAKAERRKLVYCSRTVPEVEKVVEEVRRLIAYREQELGPEGGDYLCIALSSRKNLCINPTVTTRPIPGDPSAVSVEAGLKSGAEVDSRCRDLTASWVRADEDLPHCDYFEGFENHGKDAVLKGVYSLEDLRKTGVARTWCPYFLARHMINQADLVVFSYQYMLDPKIAKLITSQFNENTIVVFDEAHNIDNVCLEALSIRLTKSTLDTAAHNITNMTEQLREIRDTDTGRLKEEYNRLIEGLEIPQAVTDALAAPILGNDIYQMVRETVPGNFRKPEHFISFLNRVLDFLKKRLNSKQASSAIEWPKEFLHQLMQGSLVDKKSLRFASSRLHSLLMTIRSRNISQFSAVSVVCEFLTLISTYEQGFSLIIDNTVEPSTLEFCCLDASIALQPLLQKYKSVVITSGTLSPIEMFQQILNIKQSVISARFQMSLHKPCICPLIITKGSDQVPITSKNEMRKDPAVARNYGNLLIELAAVVPDGMICFFPSYSYMEMMVKLWDEMGMIPNLLKNKLLFIETQSVTETTFALDNYRKACNYGRGAILFSVARGKVSEGIDFDHHYGRCVIVFGIPFVYTENRILKERLKYLRTHYDIREGDFITFDAMRTAAQCVGRVIRGKSDYGIMIFADKRYNRLDKRDKLPQWIKQFMDADKINLSTDMAVNIASNFLKQMAQPSTSEHELGTSLWTIDHVFACQANQMNTQ